MENKGSYHVTSNTVSKTLCIRVNYTFFIFLKNESMITRLQETWKIQTKVTCNSTT